MRHYWGIRNYSETWWFYLWICHLNLISDAEKSITFGNATGVSSFASTSLTERGECPLGYFECLDNNAQCVPQPWICNGVPECEDKSDEIGCGIAFHERKYWDLYFPPKPGKDEDEELDDIRSTDVHLCKYQVGFIPLPPANNILPLDEVHGVFNASLLGCHCNWEKFLCRNVHLMDLSVVPWNVEYIDLSGSLIESLDFNAPPAFPRLEHLLLSECAISEISYGSFYRLRNLKTLNLAGNQLTQIQGGAFSTNGKLEKLFLGYNLIFKLQETSFKGLELLEELDLRHNYLNETQHNVFKYLQNLKILHLNGNKFREIRSFYFEGLPSLEILSLSGNMIASIQPNSFTHVQCLKSLYLSWNLLEIIPSHVFCNLFLLVDLYLDQNRIRNIQQNAFACLHDLQSLNLKHNLLKTTEDKSKIFANLTNLQYVYFDQFWMCAWTLHVRFCEPKGDGISSVKNLLDSVVLRICVWIMGLVGILGNLFVIVSRLVFRELNPIHSFYIKNLAAADLLVGIFLVSIAFHDVKFRGKFLMFQHTWIHSFTCQFSGLLSTWNSDASVLLLALITLDRYTSIVHPLATKSTSMSTAIGLVSVLWLFSFLLSYLPLSGLLPNYFHDFYSSNGLCIPLQIHNPYDPGWEYSFVLFVLMNSVVFLFIFYAYWKMLRTIRQSSLTLRTNQENQDGILAIRFSLVVLTDFLCKGPIILTKILAMAGFEIPSDLYAWLAVFVLPVNSMLNPIIYTITTKVFKQNMAKFRVGWLRRGRRGNSQDSSTSVSVFNRRHHPRETMASVMQNCHRGGRRSNIQTYVFRNNHPSETIPMEFSRSQP